MTIVEAVTLATVQHHEQATGANVRLGGYHMDRTCPPSEFQAFRTTLDITDVGRLFLLGIPEFADCTAQGTWRLADLLPKAALLSRVASFIDGKVNLPARAQTWHC